MRILIVSTYFPPQCSIGALRPHSWAKRWSALGHDVAVVTTTKAEREEVALSLPMEGFELIEVEPPLLYRWANRLYRGKSRGGSSLRPLFALRSRLGICNSCRMPDLIDPWVGRAVDRLEGEEPWDLVVSTAGPYACHWVAERLKKRGQAAFWVADYRDLWVDSELFPGLFPFTWIERRLERRLMGVADRIVTVSAPLAEKLTRRYGGEKVSVVENGFDPSDLEGVDPAPFFPRDGKLRMVYTGMIYEGRRDPSPLFAAIDQLRTTPLLDRFELLFAGNLVANLEELIEKYQVGRWVKWVGFLSRPDALRMQRDSDALLFLEWQGGGALTGKLFEYLFSGRPIWAIGVEESHVAGQLILEAEAGLVLGADVDRIADALSGWLRGELPLSTPKREVVERYERGRLADALLGLSML